MKIKQILFLLIAIALGTVGIAFGVQGQEVQAAEIYSLTVRYVDEDGNELACEDNLQVSSSYSIPIKQITGYTYSTSDKPIAGKITEDTVITMIYKEIVYTVKVNFFDEQGNKIKDTISYPATLHTYLIIDLRKDGVIDGYTFTGDNEVIAVGIVGNITMDLVYKKTDAAAQGKGCSAGMDMTVGYVSAAAMAATGILIFRRKKV